MGMGSMCKSVGRPGISLVLRWASTEQEANGIAFLLLPLGASRVYEGGVSGTEFGS